MKNTNSTWDRRPRVHASALLAMTITASGRIGYDVPQPAPPSPPEPDYQTTHDLERINAARAKRERREARRHK